MHATSKEGGTGIGLFVARAAVEEARGTLELVSTGPAGTTFEVVLPRSEGSVGVGTS
jgi:signal transduction histidine kinase